MLTRYSLPIGFSLIYGLLCLTNVQAQCVVFQDKQGQVLTTCDYFDETNRSASPRHVQETYLGSSFLTFPVWQPGTVQLDKKGKELTCELAFNLATSEIMCRLLGDSVTRLIIPEVFTTNGTTYFRQLVKIAGAKAHIYYTPVNTGKTRLLKSLSAHLEANVTNEYNRDIKRKYVTQINYYLQRGDDQPQPIELTQKSLLNALADPSVDVQGIVPSGTLAVEQVVTVCQRYDSLCAIAQKQLAQLSWDQRLRRLLQYKIVYPGWVGKQGIYGRVYAGFTIDSTGRVGQVTLLSPDNIGFGLDAEVTKALTALPAFDRSSTGEYAIPIAFTLTNAKEKVGPHVPVNRLPDERLAKRTLLEEVVISYTVNSSAVTEREVWGYYK